MVKGKIMTKEEKEKLDFKSDEELVHTWKVVLGHLKKLKVLKKNVLKQLKNILKNLGNKSELYIKSDIS